MTRVFQIKFSCAGTTVMDMRISTYYSLGFFT